MSSAQNDNIEQLPPIPELNLCEGFRALVVRTMHATVEIHEDGRVVAHTNGKVEQHPLRWPPQPVMVVETETPQSPGRIMPDGTIYVGVSPETGRPMFTTARDSWLCDTWDAAQAYAARLVINGRSDWRVPSKAELNVMFGNAAAIRFIDMSGSYPQSWYWSSTVDQDSSQAWLQEFGRGHKYAYDKTTSAFLRCVRG